MDFSLTKRIHPKILRVLIQYKLKIKNPEGKKKGEISEFLYIWKLFWLWINRSNRYNSRNTLVYPLTHVKRMLYFLSLIPKVYISTIGWEKSWILLIFNEITNFRKKIMYLKNNSCGKVIFWQLVANFTDIIV